ncbi:MAG: 6-bladed beta-propeller, partial [Acidobacteria bacterium]|nr:6-bladed beta-propeller [Acidobacteriota bacterium]
MVFLAMMLLYGDLPQVHNGLALSEPSKDVRFIEELRFGAEPNKPDEYQWSGVCVKVSVGPDGRIYVADTGENRVLCFDDQGQFIKLVSQKGNGPGEFQTLIFFSVLQNGEAVAMDAFNDTGRFFYFNAEPKFVHQISPKPGSVRRSHLSPDGQLLWAHYIGPYSASFEVSTGVMNARFEWIEKLTTTAMEPFDGSQMRDPGYLRKRFAKNIAQDLGTRGLAGFGEHGEAFTARSDAYI